MKEHFTLIEGEGDFFLGRATSSGNMPDMHTHSAYEIFYLTSGTRKYFINDKYFLLKTGDIACIPSNAPHKTGGKSGQRLLINFSQNFIDNYITKEGQNLFLDFFNKLFLRPTTEKQNLILEQFSAINSAYNKKDIDTIVEHLFRLFFLLNECPTLQNEDSFAIKQLHKAMQYVETNYENISSLNDVAKVLFVSKFYLCRLFSKYLEISFNDYLTQVRLKNAKHYLRNTKLSVLEISLKCGFNSSAYFGAVFKKQFNITPLQFRKLHT